MKNRLDIAANHMQEFRNSNALAQGGTGDGQTAPAIIEAWMCGEQGGRAIADVQFGSCNRFDVK
jgi:hypothetical protein